MWRLWNKLFGWDYISYGTGYKARRIQLDKNNKPYTSGAGIYAEVLIPKNWIWLTCPASKYFPEFRQTENKNAVKGQCL